MIRAAATILLSLMISTRAGAEITLVTDENPPYSLLAEDGKTVSGLSADLIRQAFENAGISASFHIFPWARAFAAARNQASTCVFSTARTAERETQFKWVGPFVTDHWALFGRAGSKPLSSLQEAKGKVIGSNFGVFMTAFLRDAGMTVEEEKDDYLLNAKKLAANRIDYWLSTASVQKYFSQKTGSPEFVLVLPVKEAVGYLACNPSVADATITQLNDALAKLVQDGTAAAIRQKYQ